jgi:quinol monooxygenase YgiN
MKSSHIPSPNACRDCAFAFFTACYHNRHDRCYHYDRLNEVLAMSVESVQRVCGLRKQMIQAVLRVVAPPGKREEIIEVFHGLTGLTEVSKGCRVSRAFRDADDDAVITYWVQWDNRSQLEDHFRSERFRQLLPYIEMSTEPPEVDVSNLEQIGGIEVMVAAIAQPTN